MRCKLIPLKSLVLPLLLLFAVLILVAFSRAPLQEVHWDSPIYLYQGKRAAETPLLFNYSKHAEEISNQALGVIPLPLGEAYSEAYWRFMRIGNISLLGTIFKLTGTTEIGILLATRIYGFGFAFGILLLVIMVLDISFQCSKSISEFIHWKKSALTSGFLYSFSGAYSYITANLVSEVIAFPLMVLCIYLFIISVRTLNPIFALLSGLIGYFAYFVKMESVLFISFFYLAVWLIPFRNDRTRRGVAQLIIFSGLAAFFCYSIHAVVFYPLGNPKTLMSFVSQVGQSNTSMHAPNTKPLFLVAGGLLWIGAILSLRVVNQRICLFAWLWLLITCLPFYKSFLGNSHHQTRMLYPLLLPLFLVSTIGWRTLLYIDGRKVRLFISIIMIGITFLTYIIAVPDTYKYIREFPGAWRLQYIRIFLWPPKYESQSYPIEELQLISNFLYAKNKNLLLLVDPKIKQENLNIIRFFGNSYSSNADLALFPDPTNRLQCDQTNLIYKKEEAISYQSFSGNECCFSEAEMKEIIYLSINQTNSNKQNDSEILFSTDHFLLSRGCS